MSARVFMLKDVPDDEATDVCELLEQNNIDFYETPPGKWGVSVHALWIKEDSQLAQARALIDKYEAERAISIRNEYDKQIKDGSQQTLRNKIIDEPLKVIGYLAIVVIVLYFSINPFLNLGE